jgi:hypothetical protein
MGMNVLDRAFLAMRRRPVAYRFTLFTRILLAAGFIPTGLVKLLGERFTSLPTTNPVGAFVEAMYQTGMYWRFLGASQIAAGLLLLWPGTAHLGAALFLPILVNIFVVTVSLHFVGIPVVTGMMLLAVLWLCAWDWPRFRSLVFDAPLWTPVPRHTLDRWEAAGFTLFAGALLTFFGQTRSFLPRGLGPALVLIGFAGGAFALGRFLWRAYGARDLAPVESPS